MKTAIYVRVSTDLQAEKGYSIEAQLDKLKAYCSLNDITEYEEYVDAGYSASSLERPAIKRLIQDIRLSLVDTVIVYKLDRLSRKTKDTLYLVEDVFIKYDVKFVSLSESIDTSTSSGKFFLSILSSVAQLERENIKERGMLGMRKKAQLGLKSRTPKLLIGYDFDEKEKQYIINEYEAMQIKLIFSMYNENKGIGEIFRFLQSNYETKYGKWKSAKSVQLILDNETYVGRFKYQREFVDGNNVPQIIDDETFEKTQSIRALKRTNYYRHTSSYLLTGLLFCGECGARLRGYPKSDHSIYYYVCYSRDNTHQYMNKADKCILPYFKYEKLNDEVVSSLKRVAGDKELFDNLSMKDVIDNAEQIATLEREISKLGEKANKIVDLLIEGEIDKNVFTQKLTSVNKQKETLENQLLLLKETQKPKNNISFTEVQTLVSNFDTADMRGKRDILSQIIRKITLFKDRTLEIEWLF